MPAPPPTIFAALDRAGVSYCLLRDADRLEAFAAGGGELDVLVRRDDLARAAAALAAAGYARLAAWGYAPHHFFVRYDPRADCWLKIDVVTAVCFGRPVHALSTALAEPCLRNRRRTGAIFTPAPEEEIAALLLHCVIDKREFRPAHRTRLASLRDRVTREHALSTYLAAYWSPSCAWSDVSSRIERQDWDWLLARRADVVARIRNRDRVGTLARSARDRSLRMLQRSLGMARPRAPSVALLAPDGAGKSTLAAGIRERCALPVYAAYMGLYPSSPAKRSSARLPGVAFVRLLAVQWRRYLAARYHQAGGQIVLFDRYTYDARLAAGHGAPLRRRRIRRWLLARACPAPDLVILLDAPGDVLFDRKHEHNPDALEGQRQAYLRLAARLPRAVVVDAARDAAAVRRAVTTLLWTELLRKSPIPRPVPPARRRG